MTHHGKTYAVTGAASGIGRETARFLRAAGARVIALDLNEAADADKTIFVDMTDKASILTAIETLPADLDGLANIAGLPPTQPPHKVLKVNLLGLKLLTEHVIGKLADGAGIVNLGALASVNWANTIDRSRELLSLDLDDDIEGFCTRHEILPKQPDSYFCSKEALHIWTMQNRWTWRDRGIRMNLASPGPVETPIHKDFLDTLGARAEEDMRVMDRPGTVTDVAPVVGFLLSTDSQWIRGANVECDGGMKSHIACETHGL